MPENIYNIDDEAGFSTEHVPPTIVCDFQAQAVTSPRSYTVTIIGGGSAFLAISFSYVTSPLVE